MEEEAMLRMLREHPEEGMSALLERYAGLVYAVVRGALSGAFCAADIEGCVADAFSEFYCALDRYDPARGSLKAWLCTIARHNALDLLRRRGRDRSLPLEEAAEREDGCDLEGDFEDQEQRKALLEAVQALGEPDREIVARKFYLGQSSRVIGERLGMTAANVDTRTYRAVAKLRKALADGR